MKDNFYSISAQESGEGSFRCTLHYNAAHAIFEGHFPGNPIVPGVCTMAIVKELLGKATGRRLMLREAKAVKFLGLINPSMSPQVSISWKEDGGGIAVTASLQVGATVLFKMSAAYAATW